MGRFDKYTDYNKNAGIATVKIGAQMPVLETEFNEMQEISRNRLATFIKTYFPESILGVGTMTYESGVFTIANEIALVQGELIEITSLSIEVSNGDSIYLDVFDKEVTYEDMLKYKGNEQETTIVDNYIKDNRVGAETSRRIVLAYTLSTTNTEPDHRYLLLGTIVDDAFVPQVTKFKIIKSPVTWADLEG